MKGNLDLLAVCNPTHLAVRHINLILRFTRQILVECYRMDKIVRFAADFWDNLHVSHV
jgi:hypothetical protein